MFVIKEIIVVALASIKANLLRSTLTTLGIVIGTSAVITMFALGEGAQRAVEEQIENWLHGRSAAAALAGPRVMFREGLRAYEVRISVTLSERST